MQESETSEPRRGRTPPPVLSRLELACMKTIWCDGAKTVHQVQERLQPRRPLAYTTVLTVLDRMVRKGALTRVKQGKVHLYQPTVSLSESRHKAVAELVDLYFEGSSEKLLDFLLLTSIPAAVEYTFEGTLSDSPDINVALL